MDTRHALSSGASKAESVDHDLGVSLQYKIGPEEQRQPMRKV